MQTISRSANEQGQEQMQPSIVYWWKIWVDARRLECWCDLKSALLQLSAIRYLFPTIWYAPLSSLAIPNRKTPTGAEHDPSSRQSNTDNGG